MNMQQKEMLRLIKTGRNTVSLIAVNLGISEMRVKQELDQLAQSGRVESDLGGCHYFVTYPCLV